MTGLNSIVPMRTPGRLSSHHLRGLQGIGVSLVIVIKFLLSSGLSLDDQLTTDSYLRRRSRLDFYALTILALGPQDQQICELRVSRYC